MLKLVFEYLPGHTYELALHAVDVIDICTTHTVIKRNCCTVNFRWTRASQKVSPIQSGVR